MDDLAARVAERLGWELGYDERYDAWWMKDNKGEYFEDLDHSLSSTCWHCAGLVEAALWERGIEIKLGREGSRWWWTVLVPQPGQNLKIISCPIVDRLDDAPTAIFAAAEAALKGEHNGSNKEGSD